MSLGDVRIYCGSCDYDAPMIIDQMQKDSLNGDKIWGDLVCGRCRSVIATISVNEPGIYQFKKVEEV
jgi:hypothetical protein